MGTLHHGHHVTQLETGQVVQLGARVQRLAQHLLQRMHKEFAAAGGRSAVADTFQHTYRTTLQLVNGGATKPPTQTDVLQVGCAWLFVCGDVASVIIS